MQISDDYAYNPHHELNCILLSNRDYSLLSVGVEVSGNTVTLTRQHACRNEQLDSKTC